MEFLCESKTGESRVNNVRVKQNKQKKTHICVLHKVLYQKNHKMRFLWQSNNGKIGHILQLQTLNLNPAMDNIEGVDFW